jgi:hypothetical protein
VEFAEHVGVAAAQLSQWRNRSPHSATGKARVMSSATARHIESRCGKERGWMDHDHTVKTPGLTPEQRKVLEQWESAPPSLKRAFQAGVSGTEKPSGQRRRA